MSNHIFVKRWLWNEYLLNDKRSDDGHRFAIYQRRTQVCRKLCFCLSLCNGNKCKMYTYLFPQLHPTLAKDCSRGASRIINRYNLYRVWWANRLRNVSSTLVSVKDDQYNHRDQSLEMYSGSIVIPYTTGYGVRRERSFRIFFYINFRMRRF